MPLINYSILIRQSDSFSSYCCKRCLHKRFPNLCNIIAYFYDFFMAGILFNGCIDSYNKFRGSVDFYADIKKAF